MSGKSFIHRGLKWAFEGMLVPQDPDDKPAGVVLLERIRAHKPTKGN